MGCAAAEGATRGRSERESCAGSAASPPHLGPGQVGAVAGPALGGRAGGRRALGGSTARGAGPLAGPAPVRPSSYTWLVAGFCASSFSLGRLVGNLGTKLLVTRHFVALLVLNS